GEMRVLQIEALGFQIVEHGFDGPSLSIAGQRMMRLAGSPVCMSAFCPIRTKKECSCPGAFPTASAKSRNSDRQITKISLRAKSSL
ncbi:MAG: hypothetical protein ACREDV_08995, partial [Methylocella sp.]